MPVSEVGDAVIGRGFGLLHERGADECRRRREASVHTGQPGLRLVRAVLGGAGARRRATVRAVSVAEVVSPTEAASAPLARDLMVALVRAGVTATCSSADTPALRRPRRRLQPAGRADRARRARPERVHRGGAGRGRPGVRRGAQAPAVRHRRGQGVGARRGTAGDDVGARRGPAPRAGAAGARRRRGIGPRRAVASVVEDLADAEIAVDQQAPSELEPLRARTVAVLNRGVPSFAVDTDGTLHTSLMRSCTGWPSGVWIDPQPRRTAPDGSNFQLQHWTHTFDYALVVRRRRLAIGGRPGPQRGVLPSAAGRRRKRQRRRRIAGSGSLLEIEPAGSVAARRAQGGGQPAGLRQQSAPSTRPKAVAVRLVETCGRHNRCRDHVGAAPVSSASRVDLLEQPRLQKHRASDGLTLHGYEIATVLTRLNMPQLLDADHTSLAPEVEAAQPLYARYWLHNRGPAPLGGLPAVAHLHPQAAVAEPNGEVLLRLTAASDCTRLGAARHGAAGVPRRAGRPTRRACRSCCRAASIWRPTSR